MNKQWTSQDIFAEGALHFSRGDYSKSIAGFSKVIDIEPEHIEAYLSRGVSLSKLGDFDSAVSDFNKVIEFDPGHSKAHHFRGLVHMKRGDLEKAVEDFDKAIELNHNYAVAYYSRGAVYAELGNTEQAGEDMLMAARLGETRLQTFADDHNIWRTKFDKVQAEVMGERERDWAVGPDLHSLLETED